MTSLLRPAFALVGIFTLLLGLAAPLAFTGLAGAVFPHAAGGSLVRQGERILGSELIAQRFTGPEWFHPRPSAAGPDGFDATSSGASNLGATSARLLADVRARVAALAMPGEVPADAVTASASGLDPHISPEAARAQIARVAEARGVPPSRVAALVEQEIEGRVLGVLGEPRVNVLRLNLALAALPPVVSRRFV